MRGLKTLLIDEYGIEDKEDIDNYKNNVDERLDDGYSAKDFKQFLDLLTEYDIEHSEEFDTDLNLFVKFTQYEDSFRNTLELYKFAKDKFEYDEDLDSLITIHEANEDFEIGEEFNQFVDYFQTMKNAHEKELEGLGEELESFLELYVEFNEFGGIEVVEDKAYVLYLSIKVLNESAEITYENAVSLVETLNEM